MELHETHDELSYKNTVLRYKIMVQNTRNVTQHSHETGLPTRDPVIKFKLPI